MAGLAGSDRLLSQRRLKIDRQSTTRAGHRVTISVMDSPVDTPVDDSSSLVGRRFLDRTDAAGQLSSRLAQVAGRLPGVRAILAVDGDGELVVAAANAPGVDAEAVAALAATLVILTKGSGASCAMGALAHIVVELDEGSLVVYPMADGQGAVVALADTECDVAELVGELALAAGRLGLPGARTVVATDGSAPGRRGRNFVRPFALTGGRTESPVAADALVWCLLEPLGRITTEQVAVLRACEKPRSIGEIAEAAELPLGVVRVVVGDLMAAGWVAASMFELSSPPSVLYPRIVQALEALV